ncbi:S-layer homology domain-containing protein [Paenibacillus sp. sgz500992]
MVDAVQVSDWAKAQVAQALASGIMQGAPDGRFDPQGSASRAQTVQALANLLSATDKKGAM